MNIAFRARAGPLATIGFQIITLDQAIQLAVGAFGWYKALERTQSLSQLLSANGASLVSTSTFNRDIYSECRRQHGQVMGVVVQDGIATSTELPEASTANPADSGQACLRALTTGLLCYFNIDATTSMLAKLIPDSLLQLQQEDSTVIVEGPLLTGLRQYVVAIAAEEDSNTIRTELLDLASNHQAQLGETSPEIVLSCDSVDLCEAPLIVGCMRWMLTPLHKRDPIQYPTRSLLVWCLAPIMKKLGFQISASTGIVRTVDHYARATNSKQFIADWPEVILVATNAGQTDLCASDDNILLEEELRPRVVPLRAVPWLAFRQLRGTDSKVNIQHLVDVWTYTYEQCRQNVEATLTDPVGHIRLVPKKDQAVLLDQHAALLRIFSPHLAKVCGPSMRNFIPSRCEGIDWRPDRLEEQLRILRTTEDAFQPDSNLRDNCYILIAIVLGSLYGIVSKFCLDRNKTFSLDSEVAFQPDIIYRTRFKTWAAFVSLPLVSPPSYRDWNLMLLEVVLGRKASNLNGWPTDGDSPASQNGENGTASSTPQLRIGTVLGAQANGMAAVLDLLVRPSLKPEAISVFHIERGQLLSFPVGQHGYIEASERQELGVTMTLDPEPSTRTLRIETKVALDTSLRIDAEPCWEWDPQTVVFRCRRDGIPFCPLNIKTIVSRLQQASVPCTCGQRGLSFSMPTANWNLLDIDHLTRRTIQSSSRRRIDLRGETSEVCNAFVDVSQSEAATMYALGSIQCSDMLICNGCLPCLGKRYSERWRQGSCVIVNAAVSAK